MYAHICICHRGCPPRAGPSINQSCCELPLGEGTCPPGISGLGGSVSQDYPLEKDMVGGWGGEQEHQPDKGHLDGHQLHLPLWVCSPARQG